MLYQVTGAQVRGNNIHQPAETGAAGISITSPLYATAYLYVYSGYFQGFQPEIDCNGRANVGIRGGSSADGSIDARHCTMV